MAAHLITTRLRPRLSRSSFLVGVAGAWRQRELLPGDGLEGVGTSGAGHGSQPYYSSPEVMGSAQSSSWVLGWRLQHSKTLFGLSNLNLSDASTERIAPAAGIACQRGLLQTIRQQHTDEWLVQRALADRRRRQAKQRARPISAVDKGDGVVPFVASEGDYILPVTSEEEKIAGVLGRPDLIVTRNVEWANLAFGFEQQNKYVIMDPREPQAPVGYILEDSNILMRQFLRRRRPFVAQVLDAYGNEICSVRRPIWLINSTIFVEVNGKVIGEAHRRWHLWRRVYDCYLGSKQFAAVENPGFWYWTFTLHDENQGVLAVIDRNWRGFGFEFLTDAGQYVVRFGDSVPSYAPSALRPQPVPEDVRVTGRPILSGSPTALNEVQNLQAAAQEAEELAVSRSLSLSERAVVLALAVSLDNDYFSNHSSGFGFIPLPFFGGSEAADNVAAPENGIPRSSGFPDESSTKDSAGESWEDGGSFQDNLAAAENGIPKSSEFPDELLPEDSAVEWWEDDGSFQDDADILVDPFDVETGDW